MNLLMLFSLSMFLHPTCLIFLFVLPEIGIKHPYSRNEEEGLWCANLQPSILRH
ncbi:hypothetical protein NE237_023293 [Protea cynaroides]|uniref:Uncharacterized protein n=1 Tax=Protea cynaroides TaxID=273540 RepID=A0A9Q0HGV4_9MAGN|nr:hypothetical protein NE237_023293 [Protea cynaroides]